MSGFMKTVLKVSRPNQAFFLAKVDDIKVDDLKTEGKSPFFPPLVYLAFIALLSLFFLFGMAWRLLLGVVKSKCIWVIWRKLLTTFS